MREYLRGEYSHLLPVIIISACLTRHLKLGNSHRRKQICFESCLGLCGIWSMCHASELNDNCQQFYSLAIISHTQAFWHMRSAWIKPISPLQEKHSALWQHSDPYKHSLSNLKLNAISYSNIHIHKISYIQQFNLNNFNNQPQFPPISVLYGRYM